MLHRSQRKIPIIYTVSPKCMLTNWVLVIYSVTRVGVPITTYLFIKLAVRVVCNMAVRCIHCRGYSCCDDPMTWHTTITFSAQHFPPSTTPSKVTDSFRQLIFTQQTSLNQCYSRDFKGRFQAAKIWTTSNFIVNIVEPTMHLLLFS